VLYFVYNPYILTGLSTKKISKQVTEKRVTFYGFEDIARYILKHNTGTDHDIATVQNFIKLQSSELHNFYKDVFTKDLKIGITADTINKIIPNFIPAFDVMLAKKFEEHKDKIKGNFVITEKLDGNRIVVIKDDGIVKSFTRQGNQYEGLEEIESDIINLPLDNIVFDGELIADCKGSTHEIYTETTSKARSKGSNKTGLIFHIFDVLPLDEFQKGISKNNAVERKIDLSKIFEDYLLLHCKEVKPLYIGCDLSQINVWMEHANKQGWEGLMVNLDKPYVCKRTDSILKVKTMSSCDIKVIGFEEGTGKNEGKLGALVVDYKGYPVGVGSGFTDEDRDYIWNNKNKYLGKIIEVQYFEESKNQDGGISLRFPVFKCLRSDKTEVSYN
jgi:DNA ligase-1